MPGSTSQPLLCVIDDGQWLDQASAQELGVVARRLLGEPVALVVAAREPGGEFRGLPELLVGGLGEADARDLLGTVISRPLDEQVRERFIAETGGNPLALLELPQGLTPADLDGGFDVMAAPGLLGRLEDSFRRRLEALPQAARQLLLVARPSRPATQCWYGGRPVCSGGMEAAVPAEAEGLLTIGQRGDLPASAGAVGGVPGGVPGGTAGRAPGAGRCHRRAGRPGPPGLAPRPGGGGARCGNCRRVGTLSRPGAGARAVRRGGRVFGVLR